MTMDELVAATAAATAELAIDDNRVGAEITERTVRYYVTLGIVRPPVRDGGRSLWTRDHVNDLVRIRRAQSLGQSLKQIPRFRATQDPGAWRLANLSREVREESVGTPFAAWASGATAADLGWSVRIDSSTALSGFGTAAPTADQIARIREVLGIAD